MSATSWTIVSLLAACALGFALLWIRGERQAQADADKLMRFDSRKAAPENRLARHRELNVNRTIEADARRAAHRLGRAAINPYLPGTSSARVWHAAYQAELQELG